MISKFLQRLRSGTEAAVSSEPARTASTLAPTEPLGPVYSEGRRERILRGLDLPSSCGAEIGPLHNPLISKSGCDVLYVDHCDSEALRAIWARDPSVDTSKLHVDVVWQATSFLNALQVSSPRFKSDKRLDYVVASHVIEHVPDLIRWLSEIHQVLSPQGELRLAVPDRRFTFDYFRQDTTLSDLLSAHLAGARVPSAACILDHTLNMVNVDLTAAWSGNIDPTSLSRVYSFEYCVETARDSLVNGTYHDFHCWVFTPLSFLKLMTEMAEYDLHTFSCEAFYDTAYHDFEFILHMRPCNNKDARISSWRRVQNLPRMYAFARN